MSNQEEIMQNMSPLPWRVVRPMLGVGLIRANNDDVVLHPSFEPNEGMRNEFDIEACHSAVNATFGAGILPEEVDQIRQLLHYLVYTNMEALKEDAHNLLTRINQRRAK